MLEFTQGLNHNTDRLFKVLLSGFKIHHPVLCLQMPLFCLFVAQETIHPLSRQNRSPQTIRHRLLSCVYGVDWLQSLSDLPYLSLITQLAALVLSRVCKCVRYAGDVGWCKCLNTQKGERAGGGWGV